MASISVLMLQREQKDRLRTRRRQARHSVGPSRDTVAPKPLKNDWSSKVIRRCLAAKIFVEAEHIPATHG